MTLTDDLREQLAKLATSAARIQAGTSELAAKVAAEKQAAEEAAKKTEQGE
jgi:hypothetical protein